MKIITSQCTGCRACEQLCAKNAISLLPDKEGFLVPVIDQNLCVDCGLCKKRCPQNLPVDTFFPNKVLAVRLKDDEMLFKSASGSVFGGMSEAWIKDGGVVVGVAYDKDWNAHHVCASTLEELQPILSSKYVQADTYNTYSEVKHLLNEGKKVLYSGTGCQIGGLKAFLNKDYDNLFTMDLICHGVASPLLFRQYINWLGEKSGSPILEYDFRDKRISWGLDAFAKTKKKNSVIPCTIDPYFFRFLEGHTYRESCYQCRYCKPKRAGDITIGDYWGIEKEHPQFFSTKGVSCVLLNTSKGKGVWEKYGFLYHSIESTLEQVGRHNGNLFHPTKRIDSIRNGIYKGINEEPNWFTNKFAASFHPSLKARIKSIMPMWMRLLVAKI